MRVTWYKDDGSGLPYAYDALREAKEPCVMLKLYAHGEHDEPTGNELNEALLIPVSVIEYLAGEASRPRYVLSVPHLVED
jgi:hypothetical protein